MVSGGQVGLGRGGRRESGAHRVEPFLRPVERELRELASLGRVTFGDAHEEALGRTVRIWLKSDEIFEVNRARFGDRADQAGAFAGIRRAVDTASLERLDQRRHFARRRRQHGPNVVTDRRQVAAAQVAAAQVAAAQVAVAQVAAAQVAAAQVAAAQVAAAQVAAAQVAAAQVAAAQVAAAQVAAAQVAVAQVAAGGSRCKHRIAHRGAFDVVGEDDRAGPAVANRDFHAALQCPAGCVLASVWSDYTIAYL
jgi:hypothetical protein